MKFILRLSSALAILLLLAPRSFAQASGSPKTPAPTKGTDGISSLEQAQAALRRQPHSAKLYIQLGQAHWNAGEYEAAFDAFKEALKLAPSSAEAHNWMGAFLMGRGSLTDAIAELRKAVSLDPQYARGY